MAGQKPLLQRLEAKIAWLESELRRRREHKLIILQKELAALEERVSEPSPPVRHRRIRQGRRPGFRPL